jgi:glycosyltransferase involved in cell wall biosynthesis
LPRISVVLPAFNRERSIARAIDSVVAQDFEYFELNVVDDGSTDHTAEVARSYDDPRIRVISLERNRGSNVARNAGIEAASAPLIAFLDSDDVYLPHKLATVVRAFDEDPALDVLVDSYVKVTSPNAKRRQIERRNPVIRSTDEFARHLFGRKLWKPTSSITVTRDAASRAGMFDESVKRRQDLDFLIRLSAFANCAATDAILWVKSWTPDSISARNAFVASTIELVERHPGCLVTPDYRVGIAKDLARHVLIDLRDGRYANAAADTRLLIRKLGAAQTAALLIEGTKTLIARRRRQRDGSLAPAASAPAKARSGE